MKGFRDSLIEYLKKEKELAEEVIKEHKELSREEKIEAGFLLPQLKILQKVSISGNNEYSFSIAEMMPKMRSGDWVSISEVDNPCGTVADGMVLEVSLDTLVVITNKRFLDRRNLYDVEIQEATLYDSFISVLSQIEESDPGAYFLGELAGEEQPTVEPFYGPNQKARENAERFRDDLDQYQMDALMSSIRQPSIKLIQGPPGTGKTRVLSNIAASFSRAGMEVAIVAKTHQAVNNALNTLVSKSDDFNVVKVGQALRSKGLDEKVQNYNRYKSYLSSRKRLGKNKKTADVVGMTLQASSINLGLRNSGFKPQVILVDESSQIPLAEAAMLGATGAGTVIFIGDDRQMPPIFFEELIDDSLSVSVFQHLKELYPTICSVLSTSYRMNEEICSFVSKHYYEQFGICLVSSEFSKDRRIVFDTNDKVDDSPWPLFSSQVPCIITLNVSRENTWRDGNPEEARFAAELAAFAITHGIQAKDIAIVTPFRRQVVLVRSEVNKLNREDMKDLLIDTVERMQGLDVRIVIISFSVTDSRYYESMWSFLENRQRLNVMISRAKEKVLILNSGLVRL